MSHPNEILEGCDYGLTSAQTAAVKDILLHRERCQRAEAMALQKQAAAAHGERYIKRFGNDNQGYVNLSISPYLYHKLGSFYGYACWDDMDFLKNVWRHYPETRVKSRSTNPTVTVLADVVPRKVKFSKTYSSAERVPHTFKPEAIACAA
jgi:hypothetical protein